MFFETLLACDRIEACTRAGDWPGRLLNDALDATVARDPTKTAIVDPRGRVSYGSLRELVDRAALGLLGRGLRKGDVVAVQLPNWSEFVVSTLALERIGAVICPMAPIFRHREVRSILRLARPAAVVIPERFRGFDFPAMYDEVLSEVDGVHTRVVVGGAAGSRGIEWEALLQSGARLSAPDALDWLRISPNDVAELIFTSGTTGQPKGVLHTPNTLAAGVDPLIRCQGLTAADVFHMASTMGHQTGFLYGMVTPLCLGATMVFQDVWDAGRFVDLVEGERVTFTMGATPFLADTLAASGGGRDLSSLRIFICGGAPIPRPVAEEARRRLPCRLVPGWGMTEVGLVSTVWDGDPAEKILSSDGRAHPGMEIVVRAPDGSRLPPGDEGELWVRGAATFVGYVQGRRFTEGFFDPDGWFTTGDLARMDPEGFVRITGRSKDLIIRGGENVPVKEIEDVLLRHPKVRNVALVALPDARLGETGCACVIAENEPPTLAELCEFLAAQQVTKQFWPERLEILSELPMTPSGKIQKFKLRDRFAVSD